MAFGIGPVLTMAAVDALIAHGTDDAQAHLSAEARLRRMDGHHAAHRAAGRLRRRRAAHQGRARGTTAAIASPGRRSSSPMASTTSPTTSCISCWRGCPTRRPAPAASRCSWCRNSCQCGRLARRAQRRARPFDRAQARHSRLAHLHHGVRRPGRRHRLPDRRRKPRHGLHVHDDEPGAARRSRCRASAIAERATQQALAYARERQQGRAAGAQAPAPSPIIAHPDVKRMLLTMRALTRAARAHLLRHRGRASTARIAAPTTRRRGKAAHERASLLTPVAKAFSTDIGSEVASLGVQVHGGMGYIEETGAAQHYRDARIAAIYEGTNGIQAIDLVTRKLPLSGGATVQDAVSASCATPSTAVQRRQRSGLRRDRRAARRGGRQPRARHRLAARPARRQRPRGGARRRHALSAAVRARGGRRAARRGGAGGGTPRRRRRPSRPRASRSRASSPRISRSRRRASSAP